MQSLENKNIVRLYQVIETSRQIFLVMEFGEGGDLWDHVSDNGALPPDRARHIFRQILQGVEFCHANNIAHRDLKAENILFTDAQAKIVKITDFGFCGRFEPGEMMDTMCGSLAYSAPEVQWPGHFMFAAHSHSLANFSAVYDPNRGVIDVRRTLRALLDSPFFYLMVDWHSKSDAVTNSRS